MNGAASQQFEFVVYSEFFFFVSGDSEIVPLGVSEFCLDHLLYALMLFGEFLNMPLQSHAVPHLSKAGN